VRVVLMISLLVVAACGGAAPSAPPTEAQFLAECRKIYADADDAQSAEAICAEQWGFEQTNQDLANTALIAVGAAPLEAQSVAALLPGVTWRAPEGGAAANGALGPLDVRVEASQPTSLVFSWGAVGTPIPYDAKYALESRGVRFESVACQAFGASESTEVFVATPRGGAPFGVTIYRREAPTASAHAFYTVTLDLSGAAPTTESALAPARAQGDTSWAESCDASNAQYQ